MGLFSGIGKLVGSITGGDLLSAGVGILGGVLGSKASKNAANTQAASAQQAADLQKEMYYKNIELQKPFREAGLSAQNKLLDYMGLAPGAGGKYTKDFSMQDFQQDPGYAFRIAEGMKALDRTAASRGGLLSGATLRGATRYGQEMGSQEYQNAFNRYQTNRANQLNPLQSLMGSGQTAANQVGAAGQNYANQAGDAYMGAGNARASGYVGSANAWSNALGGVANTYNQNQMLNRLLPQSGNIVGGGENPYYSSVSGGMVI
jgi:hypothetical protein